MRIIIATGIYPPHIGGPAQYAKGLEEALSMNGIGVRVLTYRLERGLPTGLRHLLFFMRVLFALPRYDAVIALDTFSVGFSTVCAARLLGKKVIIRTGGDFLWEGYVERTGDKILLRNFYETTRRKWNLKERLIYRLTKWTLQNVNALVFSTKWQREIFEKAYNLDPKKSKIIENFYGSKLKSEDPRTNTRAKTFVAGTRSLKWKNLDTLERAFDEAKVKDPQLFLDTGNLPYEQFLDKIKHSYAVILVSLGDISPNMILDALRFGKPFILTRETGLYERLKDVGLFVDPLDRKDIESKILMLADSSKYEIYKRKSELYSFTHSFEEIAAEFLQILENKS